MLKNLANFLILDSIIFNFYILIVLYVNFFYGFNIISFIILITYSIVFLICFVYFLVPKNQYYNFNLELLLLNYLSMLLYYINHFGLVLDVNLYEVYYYFDNRQRVLLISFIFLFFLLIFFIIVVSLLQKRNMYNKIEKLEELVRLNTIHFEELQEINIE